MEDKQSKNLEEWASGAGIEFDSDEAKAAYQYRATLIKDAIQLQKTPDRVPIVPMITWAPSVLYNVSTKDMVYNPDVLGKVYYDFACEFDADTANNPAKCSHGPTLEAIDYQLYKWAGGALHDYSATQYVEKEYMSEDEYDLLIRDPSDFMLRRFMPRIGGTLGSIANLGSLFGLLETTMSNGLFVSFGAPEVQEAFTSFLKATKTHYEWMTKLRPHINKIQAAGYPFSYGGSTKVPFDVIGDTLRGTTPLMMDMYRRPEKVLAACERLLPVMIKYGIDNFKATKNPNIFIPLHKGADGFMSDKQFQKFYWPFMKGLAEGLIEGGCVPCFFVEGYYNQRLQYLTDIPKGKVVYYFDKIDMAEARKTLDGIACIAGGFPVSQILTGTADTVREETRKLLEVAAGDGGYILGIDTTLDEVKRENLHAFMQAGKEFGRYQNPGRLGARLMHG